MKNKSLIIAVMWAGHWFAVHGQSTWELPEGAGEALSILRFDEDMALEGQLIYATSCKSCHGTPTQGDFVMMAPPPGDVAEERFRIQKDGALFYKIRHGRGAMPAFENTFSENEIWSLVAHIRSFHSAYEQEMPDMEGIEIPVLALELGFDENIDKLVIRVLEEGKGHCEGASVKAFVKGMFGNHFLGSAQSNEMGLAWIDIDAELPGDHEGRVEVLIKAGKGYGSVRLEQEIRAARPSSPVSLTQGRHLWSPARKAPVWMIIIFNLIGVGIWSMIIYIVVGLRKIKKLQ